MEQFEDIWQKVRKDCHRLCSKLFSLSIHRFFFSLSLTLKWSNISSTCISQSYFLPSAMKNVKRWNIHGMKQEKKLKIYTLEGVTNEFLHFLFFKIKLIKSLQMKCYANHQWFSILAVLIIRVWVINMGKMLWNVQYVYCIYPGSHFHYEHLQYRCWNLRPYFLIW